MSDLPTAAATLTALRADGIAATLRGGQILLTPPGSVTPHHRQTVRDTGAALAALLQLRAAAAPAPAAIEAAA